MSERMRHDAEVIALEGEVARAERQALLQPPATLSIIPLFMRQAWHEGRIRWLRHIQFRSRENEAARVAYAAMDAWEFEGVNARQAWANWRTIARNLAAGAPAEPLRALDLCCGTGQSTAVLAYHLPPGSEILGFDFSPRLVRVARARAYVTSSGDDAPVRFRAQSVLEPLCDEVGALIGDGCIDLVNSCGAVGCHFDAATTRTLAAEVARVVRPGGLAMIDSGRSGTRLADVKAIFESQGFKEVNRARSCFLDPYVQICFLKTGGGD